MIRGDPSVQSFFLLLSEPTTLILYPVAFVYLMAPLFLLHGDWLYVPLFLQLFSTIYVRTIFTVFR